MKNKTRYYYLDILKFIAILSVCCYHFSWIQNLNNPQSININIITKSFLFGINSICIPLFFMINGALVLNKKQNNDTIINKGIKLLGQFYIWKIITIIIIAIFNNINLLEINIITLLNAIFFLGKLPNIDYVHLWFIPLLFSIYLITPILNNFINNYTNKKTLIFIFLFLCFIINDLSIIYPNIEFQNLKDLNPFNWIVGPMIFYFILGNYFHQNRHKINIKKRYLIIIFLLGASLQCIEWLFQYKYNLPRDMIFDSYNTCSTLLMTTSIFLLISKIPNKKIEKNKIITNILTLVSNNTLTVYYCHWIIGYTILPIIHKQYINSYGILPNTIKALSLVLICSLLGELFKKIPIIKKIIH